MNLLDLVKDQVSGSLVSQASNFLGESEDGISQALNGIFPSLLGKMIDTTQETDGAQKIFDMASGMDESFLGDIGGLFGGGAGNVAKLMNSGSGVLNLLLGSNTGGLIEKIADLSGLKGSAASSLIKMAAPFLMSMVGKYVKDKALDAVGLGSFLGSQKDFVKSALPGSFLDSLGLGFLGKGLGSLTGMASGAVDTLGNATSSTLEAGKDLAEGAMDTISDATGATLDAGKDVAGGVMDAGAKVISGVGDAADATLDAGKNVVGGVMDTGAKVVSGVGDAADATLDAGKNVVGGVMDTGAKVVSGIGDAADATLDAGKNVVGGVMDTGAKVISGVGDAADATLDAGKDLAGGAMDTISDAAGATLDAGKDLAGGAMDAGAKVISGVGDLTSDALDTGKKVGGSLLKWLIPAILILAALSFFSIKTCSPIDKAADAVGSAAGSAIEGAGDVAQNASDIASDAASAVGEAASGTIVGLFGAVDEAAKKLLSSVKFVAGSAGDQMMKYINGGFKGDPNFKFNNLSFDKGKASISGKTAVEVDNIASILNAYPKVKIAVNGYTDNTGDSNFNKQLSKARANAVKARLIAKGIMADRVLTNGYGEANPVASNETVEGQAQNRRIELQIIK